MQRCWPASGRTTSAWPGPGTAPASAAAVQLTEPLGDITVLDLDLAAQILKMVLPEERAVAIKPGPAIEVVIAARNLHLFDRDTGRRID